VKLLLDENLSDWIIPKIIDLYPNSEHVKTLRLVNTDDVVIWEFAKSNDFVIVCKNSDFHQRSLLYGHPPKFIYLRIGNSTTSKIVQIMRDKFDTIRTFVDSELESILVFMYVEYRDEYWFERWHGVRPAGASHFTYNSKHDAVGVCFKPIARTDYAYECKLTHEIEYYLVRSRTRVRVRRTQQALRAIV
jgi:predicted nuclease of predicted toxin-antitoxin system